MVISFSKNLLFGLITFFVCGITGSQGSMTLTEQEVCAKATTNSSSYGRVWVGSDGRYGRFVEEALNRGYSCGVYASMPNELVCKYFLSSQRNSKANVTDKKKWLFEVERRSLDCSSGKATVVNKADNPIKKSPETHNSPPEIEIIKTSVSGKLAFLEVRVVDDISVREVRVNDDLVNLDAYGVLRYSTYAPVGESLFVISAIDSSGLASSKRVSLSRDAVGQKALKVNFESLNPIGAKGRSNNDAVALIIGIGDYNSPLGPAVFADSDAQMFGDFATEKLGIPSARVKTLINEQAAERDMLLALKRWLLRVVEQDKTDVYIFFAGHGLASDDGKKMYLLPYDGAPDLLDKTAIQRDELFRDIASVNPRSVTVFLDTCYSGTTRGTDMLIASRPIGIKALEQSIPDNFTVLTAARGDQTAKPLDEAKHGMFSYYLMKGMEGDADINNDKKITAGELHSYIQSNVIQQSNGSQTPELQGDAGRVLVRFQ